MTSLHSEPPPASATSDTTADAAARYLPPPRRRGAGLALSGGGFRAALFHLGVLRRLNEVGVLSQMNTISCVSGGSIVAAHLARHMQPWPARGQPYAEFPPIAESFERFAGRNLRTAPIARRLLMPWNWPREETQIEALTELFDRWLNGARLRDLPFAPEFVFCASDNAFGINWTMRRRRMSSYLAGWTPTPADWTVGRAVAASSCFPPVFDPMSLHIEPAQFQRSYYQGPRETYERLIRGLRLSDGGLYDNLALEPIWKVRRIVIVSDGGATFNPEADAGLWWRVKRYAAIMGRQATALRKRWLIASYITETMCGAYIGIGSHVGRYGSAGPGYSAELVREVIATVRTDLDSFSEAEARVLQNHGYLMADAAIKKHLAPVMNVLDAPVQIPFEDEMDESFVRSQLATSHERHLPFGRGPWLPYLFR